ncbi:MULTISPECIES: twin-arginine translocase TatA/TatE family subunit [Culturomica]|jgi:sec-independent protein translocase protein TatA|uniref:twin-arginine translocase TatA/TatE family subunit n=2 Tax=Culturomica TaxID=1926651 RepID=UPI00033DEA96|nr:MULTISPECIES: twin-arginine translocase TatA/TatE family subunit [Culturomica]CCZ07079.1 tatA/E family twin arginine-targeting protein translocase [Odoribacter sp. CAG:788]
MNTVLMIGTTQLVVIVLVVLLLFGGKKIPELMKGLGKGVKSFKDGMNGLDEENKNDNKNNTEKEK